MQFEYTPGSTPLDQDECDGLIPLHINRQSELNEWEQENILKAEEWLFSKSSHRNFLSIEFMCLLHKKMFNKTWIWAGKFRTTEKSIGVAPFDITTQTKNLFDDIQAQLMSCTTIDSDKFGREIDEIAYRFHHRLVKIHPFPNDNGRHARMMTDSLLAQAGRPRFTWGKQNLVAISSTRDKYIAALRNADKHDYALLAAFVRS